MKKVSIDKLQRGAVVEMFDEELKKVLANIDDENTRADYARSITVKFSIKPDKTRRTAETSLEVKSTLAPIKPSESFLFFDHDENGEIQAYEDEPTPDLPGINDPAVFSTAAK